MQIERLIQMIFLLVGRGHITARELAAYFDVSKRTVLRDIDKLSLASIPVYTTKGNGGGISILKEYAIDRSLLSPQERERIMNGLQILQATRVPNTEQVLDKIGALFRSEKKPSWIDVDFSFFGSEEKEKLKFSHIQEAIIKKHVMNFEYFTSELQFNERCVEPLKLLFRHQAWYIFGYCRYKNDYRLFRTSRMRNIIITDERFERELTADTEIEPDYKKSYELKLFKFRFSPEIAHRVYDEYEEKDVSFCEDGSCLVTCHYAVNEWVLRHILSFGSYIEVLEPLEVRKLIKERAQKIASYYSKVTYICPFHEIGWSV